MQIRHHHFKYLIKTFDTACSKLKLITESRTRGLIKIPENYVGSEWLVISQDYADIPIEKL